MKFLPYVIVLIFTATAVWADKIWTFEQLDANSDGYISQKEAKARKDLSENWKIADKNADGKLDSAEFIAYESRGQYEPPNDSMERGIGAAPTP